MPENCYLILGLSQGANREEIRQAYRAIIRKLHPDVTRTEDSTPEFLRVREAYETLMDADRRHEHDRRLNRPVAARPAAAGSAFVSTGTPFREPRSYGFEELLFHFFERAAGRRGLSLEIVLSPEEASCGGRLPMALEETCPRCAGRGVEWEMFCPRCRGRGRVGVDREIVLEIPPGIEDGTVLTLSLSDFGCPELLRAVVLVRGHVA